MRYGIIGMLALAAASMTAATFEVGPGRDYGSIGAVPWAALEAGDTVRIYWRAEPYREKWVICRQGTEEAPITVSGVAGPDAQLPVIDGDGAVSPASLNYWNEARGVLKIGGASVPADAMPRWIVVENLEIRNAHASYSFTAANGATQKYAANAAALYVEKGEFLTIRNCTLHASGNGLFIGTPRETPTHDVLVQSNYIFGNGNVGSLYEHNSYTAALGITFQFNRYGPLRAGANGNNLKDRSAGLVVRWNWIEGGNRELDLVDAEDSSVLQQDARYRETLVYGNVLIEPAGDGNRQIVHYGGDSGNTGQYRKGVLRFFNNTVVSNRTDRTTLFRLSTNDERCEATGNIFYPVLAGNTVSLLDSSGVLAFSRNWIKPGWRVAFVEPEGRVEDGGGMVEGDAPGFTDESGQDYRLASGSPCIDGAGDPPAELGFQYVKHQAGEARPAAGAPDIGAFEHPGAPVRADARQCANSPRGRRRAR